MHRSRVLHKVLLFALNLVPGGGVDDGRVRVERDLRPLVLLGEVLALVPGHVPPDEDGHDDEGEENDGEDAAQDGGVGLVVRVPDLLLVHVRGWSSLDDVGRVGYGLDAAKVLDDGRAERPDVGRTALLEEQLQGVDVVELDAGDAPGEALGHALVATDVHVLDVVELRVRGGFDVEMELSRLVVVDLEDQGGSGIFTTWDIELRYSNAWVAFCN